MSHAFAVLGPDLLQGSSPGSWMTTCQHLNCLLLEVMKWDQAVRTTRRAPETRTDAFHLRLRCSKNQTAWLSRQEDTAWGSGTVAKMSLLNNLTPQEAQEEKMLLDTTPYQSRQHQPAQKWGFPAKLDTTPTKANAQAPGTKERRKARETSEPRVLAGQWKN